MHGKGQGAPQSDKEALKWYQKQQGKGMLVNSSTLVPCMQKAKTCLRASRKLRRGVKSQQIKAFMQLKKPLKLKVMIKCAAKLLVLLLTYQFHRLQSPVAQIAVSLRPIFEHMGAAKRRHTAAKSAKLPCLV